MASVLLLQSPSFSTNLNVAVPRTYSFNVQNIRRTFFELTPAPESINTTSVEKFPIEKRRRSEIIRDRKRGIVKPEPPNLEFGWKRTKEINLEKPKGYVIMDFLEKFEGLMARQFGSKKKFE
ncbi:hypothetical protein EUTSA_v10012149mg [Eutrema salsugineum]|uniref:Uncharacterized protein n=1 Tax=Eutrema salsugineum TaxID=72664 RepID=V4KKB4_EUTSA|nr:hypothetical protein EUTSA_v10012149mg [Eutrema salsugineum]